eukprot:4336739-Pyramimonas_sp.AAC.1
MNRFGTAKRIPSTGWPDAVKPFSRSGVVLENAVPVFKLSPFDERAAVLARAARYVYADEDEVAVALVGLVVVVVAVVVVVVAVLVVVAVVVVIE